MAPSMDKGISDNLERRGNEKLLLCPSLYAKHKNFDTMIEAVAQLRRKGLDVRLLLACTIDPEADPYQEKTSRVIRESGIDEGLTMLGNQPYANMPLLYRSADVVLWPTFTESFGHPLLEAMASGKAICASDIAVNREILQDAALYFDTFEAAAMAEKIEASLEADTATRLVDAGRRRVRDFSWRRHVRSFVEIFTGLGAG